MTLYVAGFVTLPALIGLAWLIATALEHGKLIECRACGYSTGPPERTRRITCWIRWRWHKLTTGHHTRRWRRQRKQIHAALSGTNDRGRYR